MSRMKVAIGIDLGTTKCCVGVVRDGKVVIIENERESNTTPSYVAFTDTERLVGEDAKDQATINPTNTVYGIKNIVGRNLGDLQLQKTVKNMPYSIESNVGETYINVSCKGEKEVLLPQQIIAMLITKMKNLAQTHLGCPVEEAVISVPASFTNAQRHATKDAATIAGLKVLALINEPTAAAIAYQANRKEEVEENIAVVDFGGGKLDVAIVTVSDACVAVKGLSGTTDLGGNYADEVLMDLVLKKFREKFDEDPPKGTAVSELLRVACVKLKHVLSLLPEVQYQVDCFGDNFNLPIFICREKYTNMISDRISSCLVTHLEHALRASGLCKSNVSRVVLVGGSTRIPLVSDEIQGFFSSSKLESSVNPDETVAQGTAIYAALLSGDNSLIELTVHDKLLNSFSFAAEGSRELQNIFCNQVAIPASKDYTFNGEDQFKLFKFYEELSGGTDPQQLIGTLCLSDEFTKAVRLVTCVVFEIDQCGILDVIVHLGPVQDPNYAFRDVVRNYCGRLSSERLQEALDKEQQFKRQEQKDEKARDEVSPSRLQGRIQTSESRQSFPDLVTDASTDVVETPDPKVNVDNSDSTTEIESPEKLEGLAAVEELQSYSSDVATFLANADITEVPEIANKIKEQLNQLDEWFRLEESHSKRECDTKRAALDNVLKALEHALELKRPERERKASIIDLRAYCAKLQVSVSHKTAYQVDLQLVDEIIDEAKDILQWLGCNESVSKEECAKIKTSLEEKFKVLQRRADKRKRDRDAELEKERFDVANVLWNRCHGFRSKVRLSNIDTFDAPLAKHIFAEVDRVIHWLTRSGKLASKVECDKRTEVIENYEEMFAIWVKEHEQKVLLQKKENERADNRKKEEKERSDAYQKGEQQRADAHEKEDKERCDATKKEEKERVDALQKEERQQAAALVKEDKQRTDAFEKEEKERAAAVKKQEKARTDAAKKQAKERADAIKKQEKERASAAKKQEKAREAAAKRQEKERADAARYAK